MLTQKRLLIVIAALSVIAQTRNNPSVFQWVNCSTVVHSHQGITINDKNQLLIHTSPWMNLKGIMLCGKKPILKQLHIVQFRLYNSL